MKLIVNGDDYGLTMGVSKAIVQSMKNGIMGDTTAMANMPAFEESIKYALENGITEMGVHLTLSCGKPVLPASEVSSLIDENGKFTKKVYKEGTYDIDEVKNEFKAQIEKFLATGMKMNHIDGHHHLYAIVPAILFDVIELGKEYGVPVRCAFNRDLPLFKKNGIKCPEYMVTDFYDENVSEEYLINRIKGLQDEGYEVVEFMAHPAYIDEELKNLSSYVNPRAEELKIYTSERLKKFISDNNIEIVSYSSL